MGNPLTDLLAKKDVLLADGAMGTNLFALGLETGDSPELWNVEHPDRVAAVHRSFVAAGSDIFLANTFGGNRFRLALHGAEGRVGELNLAGARLAREVAEAAGRPIAVAGSMGPTGEMFQPVGSLSHEEGREAFAEQAVALRDGGVDVLWIETFSAAEELRAAVAGAATAGLPIVATMTFDTQGRTMMGLTPEAAVDLTRDLEPGLAAFGANCGIGPAQLLVTVLALTQAAGPDSVIVAKGNCGIPEYVDGAIRYSGTPRIMAEYACMARDAGARIIGGCCGTTADHLRAMAKALAERPRGPRPEIADIERVLGPVAVAPSKAGEGAAVERSHRRRRRARPSPAMRNPDGSGRDGGF